MEALSSTVNNGEEVAKKGTDYSHESDSDCDSLMECSNMMEKTFTEDYLNQLHASMMSVDDAFDEDSDDENTIVLNFDQETPKDSDENRNVNPSPKPIARTDRLKNVRLRSPDSSKNITPNKRKKKDFQPPKLTDANRDIFCWRCHKYGENVISCSVCPRVYHLKCSHLQEIPVGTWICVECDAIAIAETVMSRDPATKGLSNDRLSSLLLFAIKRMRQHEGSSHFENFVDPLQYPDYKDYIVHPMCLAHLERNVKNNVYTNCESFLADAKWLLHNSYIFNSANSELTHFARAMLKHGKHECDEILNCPDCYLHANTLEEDKWFIEPCELPHILVWAKLKGWPFWPCKVMKTCGNKDVDVRFFGDHNKSIVPVENCYLYSKQMPTKQKKFAELEAAILECLRHISKLQEKFGEFNYAPMKVVFNPKHEAEQRTLLLPYVIEGVPLEEALKNRPKVRKDECKVTIVLSGASGTREIPLNWSHTTINPASRTAGVRRPILTSNSVVRGTIGHPYKHPILSKRLLSSNTQCGSSTIIIDDDSDDGLQDIPFNNEPASQANTNPSSMNSRKEASPSSSSINTFPISNTKNSKGFFLSQFNLTRTPQSIQVIENSNAPIVRRISEGEKKKEEKRVSVLKPIKSTNKIVLIAPPKVISKTGNTSNSNSFKECNQAVQDKVLKSFVTENNILSEKATNFKSNITIAKVIQTQKEDCIVGTEKRNSSSQQEVLENRNSITTHDKNRIKIRRAPRKKKTQKDSQPRVLLEKLQDSLIKKHCITLKSFEKQSKRKSPVPREAVVNWDILNGNINDIVPISQVDLDLNTDDSDESTGSIGQLETVAIKTESDAKESDTTIDSIDENVIQSLAKSYSFSSGNEKNTNSQSNESDQEIQNAHPEKSVQNNSNSPHLKKISMAPAKRKKVPFSSICNTHLLQKYVKRIHKKKILAARRKHPAKKVNLEKSVSSVNNKEGPEELSDFVSSPEHSELSESPSSLVLSSSDDEDLQEKETSSVNTVTETDPINQRPQTTSVHDEVPSRSKSSLITACDKETISKNQISSVDNEIISENQLSMSISSDSNDMSIDSEPETFQSNGNNIGDCNENNMYSKCDYLTGELPDLEISEHSFHSSDDEDISFLASSEKYINEMYGVRKRNPSLSEMNSENSRGSTELGEAVQLQQEKLKAKRNWIDKNSEAMNADEIDEETSVYSKSPKARKKSYTDDEVNDKTSETRAKNRPVDREKGIFALRIAKLKKRPLFNRIPEFYSNKTLNDPEQINGISEKHKPFTSTNFLSQKYESSCFSKEESEQIKRLCHNGLGLSDYKLFFCLPKTYKFSNYDNKADKINIAESNDKNEGLREVEEASQEEEIEEAGGEEEARVTVVEKEAREAVVEEEEGRMADTEDEGEVANEEEEDRETSGEEEARVVDEEDDASEEDESRVADEEEARAAGEGEEARVADEVEEASKEDKARGADEEEEEAREAVEDEEARVADEEEVREAGEEEEARVADEEEEATSKEDEARVADEEEEEQETRGAGEDEEARVADEEEAREAGEEEEARVADEEEEPGEEEEGKRIDNENEGRVANEEENGREADDEGSEADDGVNFYVRKEKANHLDLKNDNPLVNGSTNPKFPYKSDVIVLDEKEKDVSTLMPTSYIHVQDPALLSNDLSTDKFITRKCIDSPKRKVKFSRGLNSKVPILLPDKKPRDVQQRLLTSKLKYDEQKEKIPDDQDECSLIESRDDNEKSENEIAITKSNMDEDSLMEFEEISESTENEGLHEGEDLRVNEPEAQEINEPEEEELCGTENREIVEPEAQEFNERGKEGLCETEDTEMTEPSTQKVNEPEEEEPFETEDREMIEPGMQKVNEPEEEEPRKTEDREMIEPGMQKVNEPEEEEPCETEDREMIEPRMHKVNEPEGEELCETEDRVRIEPGMHKVNAPEGEELCKTEDREMIEPGMHKVNEPEGEELCETEDREMIEPGMQKVNEPEEEQLCETQDREINEPILKENNDPEGEKLREEEELGINEPGTQQVNELGEEEQALNEEKVTVKVEVTEGEAGDVYKAQRESAKVNQRILNVLAQQSLYHSDLEEQLLIPEGKVFDNVGAMVFEEMKEFCREIENDIIKPEKVEFLRAKFNEFETKIMDTLQDQQRDFAEEMDSLCTIERERWKKNVKDVCTDEMKMMIEEIKKKYWCILCLSEAKFHCCWSTSYCSEKCQLADWPVHVKDCTQYKMRAGDPDLRLSPAYKTLLLKQNSERITIGELLRSSREVNEHPQEDLNFPLQNEEDIENSQEAGGSGSSPQTSGIQRSPVETVSKSLNAFNPSSVQGKTFIRVSKEDISKGQTLLKLLNNRPLDSAGSSSKKVLLKLPLRGNEGRTLVSVGQPLPPKSISTYSVPGKMHQMVVVGKNKFIIPAGVPSTKLFTSSSSRTNASVEPGDKTGVSTQSKSNLLLSLPKSSSSLLGVASTSQPSTKQKTIVIVDKGSGTKYAVVQNSKGTYEVASTLKDNDRQS